MSVEISKFNGNIVFGLSNDEVTVSKLHGHVVLQPNASIDIPKIVSFVVLESGGEAIFEEMSGGLIVSGLSFNRANTATPTQCSTPFACEDGEVCWQYYNGAYIGVTAVCSYNNQVVKIMGDKYKR